jgi:two-component system sensor histidine kinase EvgS
LKKIFFYILFVFILLAWAAYFHLIPNEGFDFFQHPQLASWLVGICLILIPILCLLMYQLLKTYYSFVDTQKNIGSMMKLHEHTKEASSAKSIYLATISHEIRNPLQAILGTHELLLKDISMAKESKRLIQSAYSTSKSLLEMLNQVLDLTKIEAGKSTAQYEPCSLRELIEHLSQSFKGLSDLKNLHFYLHIDSVLAPSLMIDQTRLKQILVNLMSNAIKFTQRGSIFLSINVLSDTHAEQLLQIQMIDSGCGIPKTDLERIFQPYERSQCSQTQAIPGGGLGLSITNELLHSMGSYLKIDSTHHIGTCASFRICFQRTSALPISKLESIKANDLAIHHPIFSGKTALIVDDYPACREIVSQQLKHFGFVCLQAHNAEDALHIIRHESIDLVLTDEFMPDMTGRQLAAQILELQPLIKIIILTGDTLFANKLSNSDRQLMSAYLIKPVQLQELLSTVKKVLHETPLRWDFYRLLDFSHQDQSSAYSILRSILETQENLLEELKKSSSDRIELELKHISHKIWGGARLINAKRIIHLCLMIADAQESDDSYLFDQLFNELKILNIDIKEFLSVERMACL